MQISNITLFSLLFLLPIDILAKSFHHRQNKHFFERIPKVFHTIWIDFGRGKDVPPEYKENIAILKSLHPGWIVREWNEDKIVELIRKNCPWFLKTFLSYDYPIKKHDSARAVILYYCGGIYLDHDIRAIRNIEPLLGNYKCVLSNGFRGGYDPSNAFMGCVKGFKLFKDYIEIMNQPNIARLHVLDATGPHLLRKILPTYLTGRYSTLTKLYDREYFHSSSQDAARGSLEELRLKNPKCYMIHGYHQAWKNMQ